MNESDLRLVEKGHTTVKAVESKRKTVLTAAIASDIGPSIQVCSLTEGALPLSNFKPIYELKGRELYQVVLLP